jgi:hypothetical protein
MFRIVCYTGSGDYLKTNVTINYFITYKMPPEIKNELDTLNTDMQGDFWQYLEFKTEKAAKWFIGHRLVYNEKRKDNRKLDLMQEIFTYNNIPGPLTIKLEFDIVEV